MAIVIRITLACMVVVATGCRSDGDAAIVADAARPLDLRLWADSVVSDSAPVPTTPHDAGVPPDVGRPAADARTGPGEDVGLATEDAASAPRDARMARDGANPEIEAHSREIAVRFCDEVRRCGGNDDGPIYANYIRGCGGAYGASTEGCIEDFVLAMRELTRCCNAEFCSRRACTCQWAIECEQHYSTARCDPDVFRSIELLPQCMISGGPPTADDPTCPQGPITTCDGGVP